MSHLTCTSFLLALRGMGSLYRSEPVALCQLFLQSEASYSCLSELGELGMVQLKDLNVTVSAFQRKFVTEVRRCEEMERKLRFLEKEIREDDIVILDTGDNPEAPAPREMTDLELMFERLVKEVRDLNTSAEALKQNFLDLTQLKHILRKTHTFFDEVDRHYDSALIDLQAEGTESVNLLADDSLLVTPHTIRFEFVAGVVERQHLSAFERMLWRISMGNVLIKQVDIETPLEDPITGNSVLKSVFLIFFQGEQLKAKVKKVCAGFHATIYPCPETKAQRREMAMGVMTRIEDLNTVITQTEVHRFALLSSIAESIRIWSIKVRKIKTIYHAMNWFNIDITQKCLIGECWCPVAQLEKIQRALQRGAAKSGCSESAAILNRMDTREQPPTYHETNKFTSAFQGIVDSYGVASYREVNPALFTIISFPFLFSLMFGDAGHGFFMFLVGLLMVIFENHLLRMRITVDVWDIFFGGRYVILLMGLFSIFAGIMYNDFFSKPLNIFGSSWNTDLKNVTVDSHYASLSPINNTNGVPYFAGIDPVWQMSLNKITFLNSFKMKISIIFGVTQMFFGVILSFQNHRYFNERINIYCEFIPEMIFLFCIFGYLVILIFYKWLAYDASEASCAPSLLIGLINMFLMQYDSKEDGCPPLFKGQQAVQTCLLVLCILCVPWLLLVKPLVKHYERKRGLTYGAARSGYVLMRNGDIELQASQSMLSIQSGDVVLQDRQRDEVVHHVDGDDEECLTNASEETEFSLGDSLIHQSIHTIEYCLGCVSHTASYLRLWALSLAHSELSEVLWTMVLRRGFTLGRATHLSAVTTYLLFTPWLCLTIVILLIMEGMSAFLHTLRLHWVEFQSKFYKGEGYPFEPFVFEKFDTILAESVQT